MQLLLSRQCFALQNPAKVWVKARDRALDVDSILALPSPALRPMSARERNMQLSQGSPKRHDLAPLPKLGYPFPFSAQPHSGRVQ